jgi:hypothetical protein
MPNCFLPSHGRPQQPKNRVRAAAYIKVLAAEKDGVGSGSAVRRLPGVVIRVRMNYSA